MAAKNSTISATKASGLDPVSLMSEASRTDTCRVPTPRNLDVPPGYDLPKRVFGDKVRLGLKGSVLNEFYIIDVPASTLATNPSLWQGFFNRGRTFPVGLAAPAPNGCPPLPPPARRCAFPRARCS